MSISDYSIRKPVFAWMLMIGLIVFGAISFLGMGISKLPDVDFPVVNISVTWTGASPETMESAVSDVIENAVMSTEGIRSVTSTVQEGLSNTSIEFELSRNIDVALQEVQTKLAQAQKTLPTDIDPPVVTKTNPEDQPILWGALTGPNSLREKVLYARDHLKDAMTTSSGVGDVRLGGYVDPNMRIWLDSEKMRRNEISVDDISAAISGGTVLAPAGFMDNGSKEKNVRVLGEAATPEDFAALPITTRSGVPIWTPLTVGKVARVEEGLADVRRLSRLNGDPALGLGIIKQRGSNAVSVADGVKAKIKEISAALPKAMKLQPVIDTTKFIKDSTHELLFTLGLSALLTSIVCYVFLGSWGSAFNVILAIPTSLIGAFIALKAFGFTINTFTLLALSLSIGIVVDDAIMVLENISRYFEHGMSRVRASFVGAREITGAAVAASLAILAIFLPVVFMKGIIGKFFFQFGVAMSVAVSLSLLEALTLAPMRCSQFLTAGHDTWLGKRVNHFMDWLADLYRRGLELCLRNRLKVMLGSVALFLGSLFLLGGVNKEFVPPQDQSQFLVTIYTPLGSSMGFTDQAFRKAEEILKARPEVENFYVALGGFQGGLVNTGNMFVTLKDPDERGVQAPFKHRPSQQEFMGYVREQFNKIEGVNRATLLDLSLSGFSSGRGYPITFAVQGPDWEKLADSTRKIMAKMKESGLMTDVDSDYNPNMPEIKIYPDRAKAQARGVTITSIANTVSAAVGSLRVAKYTDETGHRDDVRIKLEDSFNRESHDIQRIWMRNVHGEMVPLSELVKMEEKSGLLTIGRYNRERAINVFANIKPGVSQSIAQDRALAAAKEILPDGYHTVLSGGSQAFKESFESLAVALVLGIFVAYMVLGAQFNSFIHPVTVLLALPFSVTGAFLALRLTGISLNIYSMIGLLLLMGIVKKNSILLVDFTNQRRSEGLGVYDALIEACPLRLRPILMTSVATIAAAIPSAIALGPGAETTRPMSVVVIGGVTLSTILTLFVVPCAYSLFSRFENRKQQALIDEAIRGLESESANAAKAAGHAREPALTV